MLVRGAGGVGLSRLRAVRGARAGADGRPKRFGGIDFGFRNPFAAVWGTLDREGVLWLTGEHYARQKSLSHHAERLPRDVEWYADPSGATERRELRLAGLVVREGNNALRPGIAAVSARLENGTLRIVEGACPNLLAEAGLYRYGDESENRRSETPVDEHNHALAALRYLISKLDAHHMARPRKLPPVEEASAEGASPTTIAPPMDTRDEAAKARARRFWEMVDNPDVWTR